MPYAGTRLQLGAVRFDDSGAYELDEGQKLVSVPREDITEIAAARTAGVPNALTVAFVGLAVVCISVGFPLWSLIVTGATANTRAELVWRIRVWYLLPFSLAGFWMLKLALTRRCVVVVHTGRRRRHLIVGGDAALDEVRDFVNQVRSTYGYL